MFFIKCTFNLLKTPNFLIRKYVILIEEVNLCIMNTLCDQCIRMRYLLKLQESFNKLINMQFRGENCRGATV